MSEQRLAQPTIIEQPTRVQIEAAKAKFWRKTIMGLSCEKLAALTGYSVAAIKIFERGYSSKGGTIAERSWRRYRLTCAGLMVQDFTWDRKSPEEAS